MGFMQLPGMFSTNTKITLQPLFRFLKIQSKPYAVSFFILIITFIQVTIPAHGEYAPERSN